MNKQSHRIVFNKARGVLMAVAETARSDHSAGSTEGTSSSSLALTLRRLSFCVWAALGMVSFLPLATAQIVADPHAPATQRPTVLPSNTGAPVVNIQTPSAAGVSRNTYSQFDVNQQGAVLNNSRTGAHTQVAGQVGANPWLAKGTAKVILNEVNSTNPSQLRGVVEVAGDRAQVVIANPSGITCDGCGFINANRATLTTGTPVVNGGSLDAYRVERGTVKIEGKGMDSGSANYTDIIARSVQVNGKAYARELKVTAGANLVSADHSKTERIQGQGEAPQVAIDTGQLGGMYANKIHLVGTEAGVGVRHAGQIGASAGEVVISADGQILSSGSILAEGPVTLQGRRIEQTKGSIASRGSVSLLAQELLSRKEALMAAGVQEDGSISGNGALKMQADSIQAQGQHVAAGEMEIKGRKVDLSDGLFEAKAEMRAEGESLTTNRATLAAKQLLMAAYVLSNRGGQIQQTGGGNSQLRARELDNTDGTILLKGETSLDVGKIDNSRGKLGVDGTLSLKTQALENTGGHVVAKKLNVDGGDAVLSNAGKLEAEELSVKGRSLTNTAGGEMLANIGRIEAQDLVNQGLVNVNQLRLDAKTLTNGGQVYADTLGVQADKLKNEQGGVIAARQSLQLGVKDELHNQGDVVSEGDLKVGTRLDAQGKATGTASFVRNQGGLIEARNRLDIDAQQTVNQRGSDGIGVIRGQTVVLKGAVRNDQGHILGVDVQYDPTKYTESGAPAGRRMDASAQTGGSASDDGRAMITATNTLVGTNKADAGLDAMARQAQASAPAQANAPAPAPAPEPAPTGEMSRARVSVSIPASKLFSVTPDGPSLIKSDERFSGDGKNWLSSELLLQQLGIDPKTLPQRLGDGYYEQRLLRDQVNHLTGRQFLDGHISNEAEYKALLENAVAAAKELGLKPGQALTEAQVKALKKDIVWLEQREVTLANGQKVQALVPQLYARVKDDDPTKVQLTKGEGVATGRSVVVDVTGQYTQQGNLMAGNSVSLKADELRLQGNVVSRDINLEAGGNIVNDGAQLVAGRHLTARAGQDILSTSTLASDGQGGVKIDRLTVWSAGNSETGQLVLEAGRDLQLHGSLVQNGKEGDEPGGATQLKAGRDIQLGTVTVSQQVHSGSGQNRRDVSTTSDAGTQVQTKGDLHLEAGRDIVGKAATLHSEKGSVVGNAKQDIRLEAGKETTVVDEVSVHVKRSLFKKTTTVTTTHVEDTQAVGSSVSGLKVDLRAGRDIVADGAQVVSDQRTQLIAGRDVTLDAAQTETREDVQQRRKTSGIFASGPSLNWGRKHQDSDNDKVTENQSGSRVASLKGDVLVQAGRHYTQKGSEVMAPEGTVQITAQQVFIGEAATHQHVTQDVRTRTSGLKLEVSSPILSAAQSIHGLSQASKNTNDPRMQAMAAFSVGMNGYNGGKAAAGAYKDGSATSGASATLTISASRSHSHSEQDVRSGAGSTVSGRNVTIQALHDPADANAAFTPMAGMDITIQGSNVQAQNVASLRAEGQIQLLAGRDSVTQGSTNNSGSAGVGVGASANTGAGAGLRVEASYAEGDSVGHTTTHRNAHVEAGQGVKLQSGGDTTLIGAVVTAPKVEADIGGKLTLRSLQDTQDYAGKQGSVSGGATFGAGADVNVSVSGSQLKHDFASVGEQTAIRAGDQGFQIVARGGTVLEGAQITSTQAAIDDHRNSFSSPSVVVQDITNHSNTQGQAFGVGSSVSGRDGKGETGSSGQTSGSSSAQGGNNAQTQQQGGKPSYSGGIGSIDQQATSVSTAGISGIAGDQAVRTGQASTSLVNTFNEAESMANLNAQVAITQAFSSVAPQAVAEFAESQRKLAAERWEAARATGDLQGMRDAKDTFEGWGEGGRYRVGAHTLAGLLGAGWQGAAGAGGSAALHDQLAGLQEQWRVNLVQAGFSDKMAAVLSQAGIQVTTMVGGASVGGLPAAQWGTAVDVNNRQLHQTERDWAKKNAAKYQEWMQTNRGESITLEDAYQRLLSAGYAIVDEAAMRTGRSDESAKAFIAGNAIKQGLFTASDAERMNPLLNGNADGSYTPEQQARFGLREPGERGKTLIGQAFEYFSQANPDPQAKFRTVDRAIKYLEEARVLYQDDAPSVEIIDRQIAQLKENLNLREIQDGVLAKISERDKLLAGLALGQPIRGLSGKALTATASKAEGMSQQAIQQEISVTQEIIAGGGGVRKVAPFNPQGLTDSCAYATCGHVSSVLDNVPYTDLDLVSDYSAKALLRDRGIVLPSNEKSLITALNPNHPAIINGDAAMRELFLENGMTIRPVYTSSGTVDIASLPEGAYVIKIVGVKNAAGVTESHAQSLIVGLDARARTFGASDRYVYDARDSIMVRDWASYKNAGNVYYYRVEKLKASP